MNPITGAADPAWRPDPDWIVRTALSYNGMLFIAGSFGRVQGAYRAGVAGIDMATGVLAPWRPILGPIGVGTGLALDGQTLYLSGSFNSVGGLPRNGSAAVDATSGATLAWDPPRPASSNYGSSVSVADGQVVRPTVVRPAGRNVHGLQAIAADGSLTSWRPTLGTNLNDDSFETVVATTTRDVIGAGLFHSESGVPSQGIAAFARSGSDAPTALSTIAIAGGIRLRWQAPSTITPTSYLIEAGSSPGTSDVLVQPTGSAATSFDAARPAAGTFFVRVRARLSTGEATAPSNEIALSLGCTAAPPAPFYPTVTVAGDRVSIGWSQSAFGDPTYYVVEAGSAPGLANLARVTTLAPAPFEAVAPDGTYFVRVRAGNACGISDPSSDVSLTVGSGGAVPAAPAWTTAMVSGSSVTLTWAPVPGAIGYLVEAGTAPTLVNAAQVPVEGTRLEAVAVATGIYSVRVRAVSPAGLGPPGQEVGVAVP
ncbi:MAG TPA: fibronectin type III domain-containing protein [Vicinamibacterales bacterium]|nr:fibronectin type III domain-containing protein [Vicinamibacterales bacterium]